MPNHKNLKDLTGLRFGRLMVVRRNGTSKFREPIWRCLCDCGIEKDIVRHSLRLGHTKSCGCLRKELSSKRMKSPEIINKLANARKLWVGEKNHFFGKHHSEKTKRTLAVSAARRKGTKLSIEARRNIGLGKAGSKNPNWRGGIYVPYGPEFTYDLKTIIRKRDDYLCQNPKCYLPENGKHHAVHHIDFCKIHNDPVNLITLCWKHHPATISGERNYWIEYYRNVQEMRGLIS